MRNGFSSLSLSSCSRKDVFLMPHYAQARQKSKDAAPPLFHPANAVEQFLKCLKANSEAVIWNEKLSEELFQLQAVVTLPGCHVGHNDAVARSQPLRNLHAVG